MVEQRLPNPFIPDMPQRIATDTSQKLSIRFGETIKSYIKKGLDMSNLTLIPLVLAGYARYIKGIDDNGNAFAPSPDPMLAELQQIVAGLEVREGEQDFSCLKQLYSRADVFGLDLYEAGLGEKIEGLDAVSIGPEMHDIHTSRERLGIASTARMWEFIKAVLKAL